MSLAKKLVVFSLAICLVAGVLAGCASKTKEETPKTLVVGEMWDIRGLDPAKHGTPVKEKAMIIES